jgi:cellulose synthase/poly-beta-1,6-N-acetylglucosamine synthase-like glycosyltransferase
MIWSDYISETETYLLGAAGIILLYQLWFHLRYMLVKKKLVTGPSGKKNAPSDATESLPGVSVIVSARNEAENLRPYLCQLLEQDYPEYEVIVVNDGSEDDTQAVLDEYAARYPRLKTSFVPREAILLSSKKMALTLGVKAARYEHLLFTDADCCPGSPHWIREMMRGYLQPGQTEVVLGAGAYFKEKGVLNRLIQYETLFTSLQYTGMAAAHRPYMGVGRNLSYKKSLFLRHNGFAHMTSIQAGDDDLLVNHLANGRNTAVVRTPESLTWSVPKQSWETWYHQRKRHLSVSPLYRTGSKVMLCTEPLSRAVFYGLLAALLCTGNPYLQAVAAGLYVLRLIVQTSVFSTSARRTGMPSIGLDIAVWDIVYPLITLWILMLPREKNTYW